MHITESMMMVPGDSLRNASTASYDPGHASKSPSGQHDEHQLKDVFQSGDGGRGEGGGGVSDRGLM